MPSRTYELFAEAMRLRCQVVCLYDGHRRELCPIVLGHSRFGEERALTFQFAGGSSRTLSREGAWRCLMLANVTDIALREGPWFAGSEHGQRQSCVDIVDLDVNPASPYRPKRRL